MLIPAIVFFAACEKEKVKDLAHGIGVQTIPVSDTLQKVITENVLLTNSHPWYIDGWAYVSNEATLHIEPGTVIKVIADERSGGGLVITRGAKIIAGGLKDMPVRFELNDTLNSCIRWTGLILLGKAPRRQPYNVQENIAALPGYSGLAYGGENAADSSGVLRYVHITGLLLLGTGSKTVIEDVTIQPLGERPFYLNRRKLP